MNKEIKEIVVIYMKKLSETEAITLHILNMQGSIRKTYTVRRI